jgi:hypothetical protein
MGQVGCDELGRRRRVVLHAQKAARPRRWRSPSTGGAGGETGRHDLGPEQNDRDPGRRSGRAARKLSYPSAGRAGPRTAGAGPGECPSRRPPAGATPAARRTELLSARTAAAGKPPLEPPAARGGGPTFVPYRKETARCGRPLPRAAGRCRRQDPAQPPRTVGSTLTTIVLLAPLGLRSAVVGQSFRSHSRSLTLSMGREPFRAASVSPSVARHASPAGRAGDALRRDRFRLTNPDKVPSGLRSGGIASRPHSRKPKMASWTRWAKAGRRGSD